MDLNIDKKTLRNFFLLICGGIVLYWLLHETERVSAVKNAVSGVLTPFILGGVFAFILNVPMRAIENKLLKKIDNEQTKRIIAVILTFIAMSIVVAGVFWLLIPQIAKTIKALIPSLYEYLVEVEAFLKNFISENPQLKEWLSENTNFESTSLKSVLEKVIAFIGNSFSTIVSGTISAVGSIFKVVFNAVIAVVFSVYCLCQKEALSRQGRKLLYAFIKENRADMLIRVLRLTNSTFSNFLSGQCVEVCILGSMFAVCMSIFRMPYVPLISVVIAVTAFIPIVGAWTGCVVGTFLILVEDPTLAVWFVIMFLVLQQIENSMIYPRVVGTSVGLPGMWVLIAVTIGGELMGFAGMFLMIPVVSVFYTLIQEFTHKKLATSTVDAAKLHPQPPELVSKFKEKRAENKEKRQLRVFARKSKRQSKKG